MGVKALWSLVACLLVSVNYYTALSGRTVGIDASVWLHNLSQNPRRVVGYVLKSSLEPVLQAFAARLQKLLDAGITPVFVFDGVRTGAKAETDANRKAIRAEHLANAQVLFNSGDLKGATAEAQQAVTVSETLVYRVIHDILRPKGIGSIRAPGEADGQLASLQIGGQVDAVDSSDGDLLVHGVTEMYTKINYDTGACYRYLAQDWAAPEPAAVAEADFEEALVAALDMVESKEADQLPEAREKKAVKKRDPVEFEAQLAMEAPIRARLRAEEALASSVNDHKPVSVKQLTDLGRLDQKFKVKGGTRRALAVHHVLTALGLTPPASLLVDQDGAPPVRTPRDRLHPQFSRLADLVLPIVRAHVGVSQTVLPRLNIADFCVG